METEATKYLKSDLFEILETIRSFSLIEKMMISPGIRPLLSPSKIPDTMRRVPVLLNSQNWADCQWKSVKSSVNTCLQGYSAKWNLLCQAWAAH